MIEPAPLYGLVLAGGRSRRMGQDKGSLTIHGVSQRRYGHDLSRPYCREVFVSCREEQVAALEPDLPLLPDTLENVGPLAGLIAAFAHRPHAAWLVVACDLPWLDATTLAHLAAARRPDAAATAFHSPVDGRPEPLVAIWEPQAVPAIAQALQTGNRSPRRILESLDCHLIEAPDPRALRNVNTPEDLAQAWREGT